MRNTEVELNAFNECVLIYICIYIEKEKTCTVGVECLTRPQTRVTLGPREFHQRLDLDLEGHHPTTSWNNCRDLVSASSKTGPRVRMTRRTPPPPRRGALTTPRPKGNVQSFQNQKRLRFASVNTPPFVSQRCSSRMHPPLPCWTTRGERSCCSSSSAWRSRTSSRHGHGHCQK